jgi:hypothetical protein
MAGECLDWTTANSIQAPSNSSSYIYYPTLCRLLSGSRFEYNIQMNLREYDVSMWTEFFRLGREISDRFL